MHPGGHLTVIAPALGADPIQLTVLGAQVISVLARMHEGQHPHGFGGVGGVFRYERKPGPSAPRIGARMMSWVSVPTEDW